MEHCIKAHERALHKQGFALRGRTVRAQLTEMTIIASLLS